MLNNSQLATLATELEQADYAALVAAQDYPALAAMLNTQPTVSNPTPQGTTPKRLTLHAVFAIIHAADAAGVSNVAASYGAILDRIDTALQANDRTAIYDYAAIVASGINDAAKAALMALLAETELDPTWQATVLSDSRVTVLGLPTINEMDVRLCLHPELWRVA